MHEEKVDKQLFELWGILNFWRRIFRSQNPRSKDTPESNQKEGTNTQNYMLRLVVTWQEICNRYTVTVRNKFHSLQELRETHTSNDKYENFVSVHMEEAAEWIIVKPRVKRIVTWEFLGKRGKPENSTLTNEKWPKKC